MEIVKVILFVAAHMITIGFLALLAMRVARVEQQKPETADLSPLESKVREMGASVRSLELEWANAFQKLRTIAGRIDKKSALAEKTLDTPVGAPEDVTGMSRSQARARLLHR